MSKRAPRVRIDRVALAGGRPVEHQVADASGEIVERIPSSADQVEHVADSEA